MKQELLDQVKFDERGLIPAILQDVFTGRVLMLAYMNRESLERTLTTGHCWFYSRSRQALWEKGATSGNYQYVHEIHRDCDQDSLLIRVHGAGPACHTGAQSCFAGEPIDTRPTSTVFFGSVDELAAVIHRCNLERPEGSYTKRLFDAGIKKIAQKVGEEGLEVALAAVGEENARLAAESADLMYHLLVLLEARGLALEEVGKVLQQRADKQS
ncbi:MAG: bifunctional phosphoribosyl-AMP cyclohydrolase/phosphoribosyl-ATP diphosphatase HisIE [bacterium]